MTTNVSSSYSPNNTYRPNIRFQNCEDLIQMHSHILWTPSSSLSLSTTYTTIASPTVTTAFIQFKIRQLDNKQLYASTNVYYLFVTGSVNTNYYTCFCIVFKTQVILLNCFYLVEVHGLTALHINSRCLLHH